MKRYTLQSAEQVTPSTLVLNLKSDDGAVFAFRPGQYAAINFYHKYRPSVVRCFSIASSPTDSGVLQFGMRTRGHYTKALTSLKPGDKVTVRGPFGGFVFDAERDRRTVFLAGGIGITPFMSMVRFANATNATNEIDLAYSCQTQDDVPYKSDLIALQEANPHFRVTFVIGSGPVDKLAGQRVVMGRLSPENIDAMIPQELLLGTTFLMCGPPPFMRAMASMLKNKGVPTSQILTEAFSQGPNRQTGKVKNWPLNMYIMSAAGLAVSGLTIMATDLLRTLPPSSIFGTKNNITKERLTNSRQTDLDSMVNALPPLMTATSTPAVNEALAAAAVAPVQQSTAPTTATPVATKPQTVTSTTPTTTTVTPTPVTTPTPVVKPAPVCTTSQSGVTTCI